MDKIIVRDGDQVNYKGNYPKFIDIVDLHFPHQIFSECDIISNMDYDKLSLHFGPDACENINQIESDILLKGEKLKIYAIFPNRRWTWKFEYNGMYFCFQFIDDYIMAKLIF